MPLEDAVQRGDREEPRVVLRELAVDLDRDPADVAAGELHREVPELGGERHERPEHLEVLRADGRDVHRVRDEPALERRHDLLGDDHPRPVLRLLGRCSEMRRDDDVRGVQQRAAVRLGREHVDRGAGDLAGLERSDERRLVDAARRAQR